MVRESDRTIPPSDGLLLTPVDECGVSGVGDLERDRPIGIQHRSRPVVTRRGSGTRCPIRSHHGLEIALEPCLGRILSGRHCPSRRSHFRPPLQSTDTCKTGRPPFMEHRLGEWIPRILGGRRGVRGWRACDRHPRDVGRDARASAFGDEPLPRFEVRGTQVECPKGP